mmetsp:Transcript_31934/g.96305  ORF Transcript_31934/g.96305 Transcript_31934/m.96305 type:complete len:715 (-) Transcript_31934:337-2481(-)
MAVPRTSQCRSAALEDGGAGIFLGSAVARYDVDELDDLGRHQRPEKFVEVRRPDGTVAKSRGERTFYGAFTGGFSAGYWNTVGSKEGWEPSSFFASRSTRSKQAAARAEDYMDEEDLREHEALHPRVVPRTEYARPNAARASGERACPVPGGLSRELEEGVFALREESLGAKLLKAGAPASSAQAAGALEEAGQAVAAALPCKAKRRYGCAPPPLGHVASASAAAVQGAEAGELEVHFQLLPRLPRSEQARVAREARAAWDRQLEVELERLWQCKADLHGVGFGDPAQPSTSRAPLERRLYMSCKRGQRSRKPLGYGDFGTGVFDMEDYDAWEDVYGTSDKQDHHEEALTSEDIEAAERAAALGEVPPTSALVDVAAGDLPGFAKASDTDDDGLDLSMWPAVRVPRGYRGTHVYPGTARDEARAGSAEHQKLLEFREKHGDQRLMHPGHRAELLGEASRGPGSVPAETAAPVSAFPGPGADGAVEQSASPLLASAGPLWQGVSDSQRQTLLQSLGRSFVLGQDQDMDGNSGRHEPFKSDPKKQKRYASFCLALEGKGSASSALGNTGGLGQAERDAELLEFGRVYRMFRAEHPQADLVMALRASSEACVAPVLRRTLHTWVPDKLLCRRWGVPPPQPAATEETRSAKRQRAYTEQVQAGMAKSAARAGTGSPADRAASPVESLAGEAPRPPSSLFAAIFGDLGSDEEATGDPAA